MISIISVEKSLYYYSSPKGNVALFNSLACQLLLSAGLLGTLPWIRTVGIRQSQEWGLYQVALSVNPFLLTSVGLSFLLECPQGKSQLNEELTLMWFSFFKDYSALDLVYDSCSPLLLHNCFMYFVQLYICLMQNVLPGLEP